MLRKVALEDLVGGFGLRALLVVVLFGNAATSISSQVQGWGVGGWVCIAEWNSTSTWEDVLFLGDRNPLENLQNSFAYLHAKRSATKESARME